MNTVWKATHIKRAQALSANARKHQWQWCNLLLEVITEPISGSHGNATVRTASLYQNSKSGKWHVRHYDEKYFERTFVTEETARMYIEEELGRVVSGEHDPSVTSQIKAFMEAAKIEDPSLATILAYYVTGRAWPRDKRVEDVSFAVHRIMSPHPDRFTLVKPGMASTEARDIMVKYNDGAGTWKKRPRSNLTSTEEFLRGAIRFVKKSTVQVRGRQLSNTQKAMLHDLADELDAELLLFAQTVGTVSKAA